MLKYEHLSRGVERTKKYIHERNTGESKSLLTSKKSMNDLFMDGIDWLNVFKLS